MYCTSPDGDGEVVAVDSVGPLIAPLSVKVLSL